MRVYEREFDGFSSSRNYSLSLVRTRMALVLDADELLTREDFIELKKFVQENPSILYNFNSELLYPDAIKVTTCMDVAISRLFEVKRHSFEPRTCNWDCFEDLVNDSGEINHPFVPVNIKHFMPPSEIIKGEQWYASDAFLREQPLKNARKYGWKKYNPWRNFFGNGEKNLDYKVLGVD